MSTAQSVRSNALAGIADGASLLVISDFDSTLTENNSDTAVPEALGLKDKQRALWQEQPRMQWTDHCSYLLAPFSREEIVQAIHDGVRVHPGCVRALEYALAGNKQEGPPGSQCGGHSLKCEVSIASDANTLFVEEVFKAQFPNVTLTEIHTNPYVDLAAGRAAEDNSAAKKETEEVLAHSKGTLRAVAEAVEPKSAVTWYEPNGHSCGFCNKTCKNMSKSEIVRRILNNTSLVDPTIIYMGDGANDICPIRNVLRPRDYAFVRKGFPLEKLVQEDCGSCQVLFFADGDEMEVLMKQVVAEVSSATSAACGVGAPLWRFGDNIDFGCPTPQSPPELTFRMPTLTQRIPKILRRCLTSLRELDEQKKEKGASAEVQEIFKEAEALVERLAQGLSQDALISDTLGAVRLPRALQQRDGESIKALRSALLPDGATSLPPKWWTGYGTRWSDLTWLQGEIATQLLLLACFNTQESPGLWRLMSYCSLNEDGLPLPEFPQPAGVTATYASTVSSWFPPPTPLQRSLKYGISRETDIYRVDKAQSVDLFLHSHILPMVGSPIQHEEATTNTTLPWQDAAALPKILRQCLWGNAVDLCMFTLDAVKDRKEEGGGGDGVNKKQQHPNPLSFVDQLDQQIITDIEGPKSVAALEARITAIVTTKTGVASNTRDSGTKGERGFFKGYVDIVMDNVGIEATSDLLLALWMVTQAQLNRPNTSGRPPLIVRFHVKPCSYYVSDVCPWDIALLLEKLEKEVDGKAFALGFQRALAEGSIEVLTDDYWVQPGEWRDMPGAVARKYFYTKKTPTTPPPAAAAAGSGDLEQTTIAKTDLVIAKGDLNYRRVFGDRHYTDIRDNNTEKGSPPSALPYYPVDAGSILADKDGWPWHTVPLASLRTVKSELAVGVNRQRLEGAQAAVRKAAGGDAAAAVDWRATGKFGQIIMLSL